MYSRDTLAHHPISSFILKLSIPDKLCLMKTSFHPPPRAERTGFFFFQIKVNVFFFLPRGIVICMTLCFDSNSADQMTGGGLCPVPIGQGSRYGHVPSVPLWVVGNGYALGKNMTFSLSPQEKQMNL